MFVIFLLYFPCRSCFRHTERWTREIPPLDGGAEGATGYDRETLRQKDLVIVGIKPLRSSGELVKSSTEGLILSGERTEAHQYISYIYVLTCVKGTGIMDDVLKTVFYDRHFQLGAKIVEFGGWEMPIQYSKGIVHEHLATRKTAGLFDVSHMGRFVFRGESLPFLCVRPVRKTQKPFQ